MDVKFLTPKREGTFIFSMLFCFLLLFNSQNGILFNHLSLAQEKVAGSALQQEKPEEFLPGPGFLEKAANFLYLLYDYIKRAVIFLLEKTIFQQNPKLATFYGEVATFLASLTAIYLLLLLISSAKKVIGVVLLLGWALFFVAIIFRGGG